MMKAISAFLLLAATLLAASLPTPAGAQGISLDQGVNIGVQLLNSLGNQNAQSRPRRYIREQRQPEQRPQHDDRQRKPPAKSADADPYLAEVQQALKDRGYDIGKVDGRWGARTETAIRLFQQREQFEPTGRITRVQIAHLQSLPIGKDTAEEASADDSDSASIPTPTPTPTDVAVTTTSESREAADFEARSPSPSDAAVNLDLPVAADDGFSLDVDALNASDEAASPRSEAVAKALTGAWRASARCEKETQTVTLRILPVQAMAQVYPVDNFMFRDVDRPGRLALEVVNFKLGNIAGSALSTLMLGEFNEETARYDFLRVAAQAQIGDIRFQGMSLAATDTTLTGDVDADRCSQVTAVRPDRLEQPDDTGVKAPVGGGTFKAADTGIRKCEALIAWGRRVQKDFPEDKGYSSKFASYAFADVEFVPVFDVPFDTIRDPQFGRNLSETMRQCSKDPLTRPKIGYISDLVLRTISGGGLNSSEARYIINDVRLTRVAVRRLVDARKAIDKAPSAEKGIILFGSELLKFETADFAMLPGRKADILRALRGELAGKAKIVISAEIGKLESLAPEERLASLATTTVLAGPVAAQLSPSDRQEFSDTLIALETDSATTAFADKMTVANNAANDLEGLVLTDGLGMPDMFKPLSHPVRERFEAQWKNERSRRMQAALEAELSTTKSYPQGLEGLRNGAEWLLNFQTRWAAYQADSLVADHVNAFLKDRRARQIVAASEFKIRLDNGAPKEASLEEYFELPSDVGSPVRLEYELVAVGL